MVAPAGHGRSGAQIMQGTHSWQATIRIDALSCVLGEREVLRDLSLEIGERRVAIVGRNGSGKTTLLRCMAGLVKPTRGAVHVHGVEVYKDRKNAIQTVGLLFQNPDQQIIFPTVSEELAFGLHQLGRSKADARNAVIEMLERFGRADWLDRPVSQLSQGQRHLVCLMAVLLMQPKVILLDEPFTGLDIPTTRALHRLLDTLEAQVIQITHAPGELRGYDRLIWIENGRVHRDGPVDQVRAEFLAAMTNDEGQNARTDLDD